MDHKLKAKFQESITAVLPITAIVLLLSITITPMPIGTLMLFLMGALLLVVGMGFFSLGVDVAMLPMGESIGIQMTKVKHASIALTCCFFIGMIITIAEPDLQVLAKQVSSIPDMVLILTVAAGVGLFLVVAMLRILWKRPLNQLLILFYAIVFGLAALTPENFVAVAFDSGGVTTGPITVPFIMALGIGMASLRSDKHSQNDSFGLVALCSIGPILSVMLLGMFYQPAGAAVSQISVPDVFTTQELGSTFATGFPTYIHEVAVALVPIVFLCALFQLISRRFRQRQLLKIGIGMLYTYIGLVTFLTGVNVGFMPAGHYIGSLLAGTPYRWILVPLGMVIGYCIVAAEPAVHVLNKQVEEISNGAISPKAMQTSLSVGVAIAIGIAMVRVLTQVSIFYFLIPGYLLAIGLTFFVPKIFTAIAFDSGGVASGPMTATFLLPFAMGACATVGGNIFTDAFGIVAMVAMTPLITIQVLGLLYKGKMQAPGAVIEVSAEELAEQLISYEEAELYA